MSQKILRTMQDDLTEIQDTKTGRKIFKKPEPERKTDLTQKPLPQQQVNFVTAISQTKTPARNIPAKTERGNFADIKGDLEKKGFSVSLPPSLQQEEKKDKKENNFFARLQEKITERKEVPLAEPPVQAEKRTEKTIIEEIRKTERIVKPEEIEKLKAAETIKQNAEERKKIEEIRRFAELEKIKEARGEKQSTADTEDAGIKKEILEEVRRGDEKIKEDLLSQIQKQEEARRREIQKAMEDVKRQEEMRKQEENKASEALKAQETRISNILKEVSNSLIQGEVKAEESKKAIIEEMRTKVLEEEKKNKEVILTQIQKQEEMRMQEVQKAQEELKRQESLRLQEAKMAQQALREEDAKRAEEATRLREAIKSQEADIANLIKLTSDPLTKEDIVKEMRVKILEEEKRNKEDILAQMKVQEVQLSDFMKEISATLRKDTPKKEEIEQEIITKIREEERKNREGILAQFKEQNVHREEEIGKLQETIRAKDAQIANLTKGISDSMQEGTERGEAEERLIAEMKAKIIELEEAKKRELDTLNQIKEEEDGQQEETAKQIGDKGLKQEEQKRLEEENERTIRKEKEQAEAEERADEEIRSRQEEENRIKEEERLRQKELEEKRQEAIKTQAAEEEEEANKRQEAAQKAEEEERVKKEALFEEKPEENASEIQPDSDTDAGTEEKTDSSEAFWNALRKSKRSDLAEVKEPSQADDSILSDFKATADTPPSEEKAAIELAAKETIAPSAQDEEMKNLIKRVSNSMETSAKNYSDQPQTITKPDKDKDLKDLLARMSSSLQKEKSTAEEYPKETLPAEQNNTKTDNESTGLLEKINADKFYWEKIQNTIKEPAVNPQQRAVGTAKIDTSPYDKPTAYTARPEETGLVMPNNVRTAQQRIRERKQENSSYVDPENRLIHGKQEFYSTMHKAIKPRTEAENLDGLDDVLKEREIELSEEEKGKRFKRDIAKKYGTQNSASSRIKVAVIGIVFLAILGGFLTVVLPKLKSAKNTATTEKSTTIVAGESIADIDKKITAASSAKQSQVMTLNYFDANLDPWKSFSDGDVVRLNITYDNQDVMLSREEALKTVLGESNASNVPDDFINAISPEYNILVFKDNGYLRLGLVFKYSASKEEEFKDIMSSWAGTNTQNKKIYAVMKSIFVNSRIIEQGTTTFQPAMYNGVELKFVNLPDSDTSMDYFLYEGYIIFTSSKDHTFQIIDLLKKIKRI